MNERDFWLSTWRSLYNRIEGFFEHEKERERMDWERCRIIAFYAYRSNPYLKHAKKRPIDLFKIPHEIEQSEALSKREVTEKEKQLFAKWDRKIEQDLKQLEANNGKK